MERIDATPIRMSDVTTQSDCSRASTPPPRKKSREEPRKKSKKAKKDKKVHDKSVDVSSSSVLTSEVTSVSTVAPIKPGVIFGSILVASTGPDLTPGSAPAASIEPDVTVSLEPDATPGSKVVPI